MTDEATGRLQHDHVVLGMAAGLGGFFMLSIMTALAKLLSVNHSVIEIAFYRNLIACLPFLFLVFAMGRREILVIRSRPMAVGARALLGVVSLVVTFAAYAAMPLADTAALMFTSALFTPLLGILLLGERVGPYRWAAVLIGFGGVIVMVQPGGAVNLVGVTLALSAALMHGMLQILLRYLGRYENPETVTFYFLVVGALVTALPLPFIAVRPTLAEVPLLFGVGLSGALAQWLLSVAFSRAPAAVVTVFNYSTIVWATLFGWFLFGDWPVSAVLAGAAVVIASNLFMMWREARVGGVTAARVRAKL